MKLDKVRKLSLIELNKEIAKTRGDIVQLRAEVLMHKLKNHRHLPATKIYLARLLTVRCEKALLAAVDQLPQNH